MRVAVVGNLAGVARNVVIGLRRAGVAADLFIEKAELDIMREDTAGQAPLEGAAIHVLDRDLNLHGLPGLVAMGALHLPVVARLMGYDIIHAHTGSLAGSPLMRQLFVRMGYKPYLAFATGSDFREVARSDRGPRGDRMREFFRNASEVLLLNIDMLYFKNEMGFPKASFFPFAIDTELFSPRALQTNTAVPDNTLKCFMMSNLDFGITDNNLNRNSMKHNDRVLHALAKFVTIDHNVHLTLLDRGSDKEEAKRLVNVLGIGEYIEFKSAMTELERIQHIQSADVVLDQFHMPAFGLGGLEAMAIGKPLVTHIDVNSFETAYRCAPDFFMNAHSVDDIFSRLLQLRDKTLRENTSARAREFVVSNHSRDVVIQKLISKYRQHLSQGNH